MQIVGCLGVTISNPLSPKAMVFTCYKATQWPIFLQCVGKFKQGRMVFSLYSFRDVMSLSKTHFLPLSIFTKF